ncbi:MAG TPA: glutaminyl-peptide cyclotransferase [Bacteroidales bacterium]|nr:glutaminyl-peptide cyclotransferase [Bacteroidales bacterium]
MKSNHLKYLFTLPSLLMFIWTISCSGRPGNKQNTLKAETVNTAEDTRSKLITLKSPEENSDFKAGEKIEVIIDISDPGRKPDSVTVSFDGQKAALLRSAPWTYSIPSSFTKNTGRKSLKVTAFLDGKANTTITRFLIINSDIVPKHYSYKVVNSYPHDKDAFTQGLFYDEGVLYEGTGETSSSLRKVELETGKVLQQLNLSSNLFGEGITLYGGRIFQVTWRSHVGFVYEKPTFKQINKIFYQTEGWGLTTMNDKIVMSDGTNVIYFLEPEMFTVVSRIEVYDNEQMVDSLNELEYINGEIWANIWMTDRIVRIDPATGKVLGYINMAGILNDPQTDTKVNVLNGIAYDKSGNRIFVTGKNWPKLFEIRITE